MEGDTDATYVLRPKEKSPAGAREEGPSPYVDMDVFAVGVRMPLPEEYPLCKGNGLPWSGIVMGDDTPCPGMRD